MEVVIFVGIQASGKSTFYRKYFFDSHVRINLDMLRTRHREKLLFDACIAAKQKVVVDNTNPTAEERARYIKPAEEAGFKIIGYYFQSKLEDCKRRNVERAPCRIVPVPGILSTSKKLEIPSLAEGFSELHYIRIDEEGEFLVEEWSDEI